MGDRGAGRVLKPQLLHRTSLSNAPSHLFPLSNNKAVIPDTGHWLICSSFGWCITHILLSSSLMQIWIWDFLHCEDDKLTHRKVKEAAHSYTKSAAGLAFEAKPGVLRACFAENASSFGHKPSDSKASHQHLPVHLPGSLSSQSPRHLHFLSHQLPQRQGQGLLLAATEVFTPRGHLSSYLIYRERKLQPTTLRLGAVILTVFLEVPALEVPGI